jgi:polysaccharide export outer membrane protein
LADRVAVEDELRETASGRMLHGRVRHSSTSLADLWALAYQNWRLFLCIIAGFAAACLTYWVIAPNQYEATGKIELRSAPESVLTIDGRQASVSGTFATGQVRLETLANVLRSEQLAWDVIKRLELDKNAGFSESFQRRFAGFRPETASADAKEYLLNEFHEDLTVESVPHTLVLEIRFRSGDSALSAAVVNALIEAEARQEMNGRLQGTHNGTAWLNAQLRELKEKLNRDEQRLTEFQREHGILGSADAMKDGKDGSAALAEVDALSRELGNATTERLLREAEYRAASTGDPELVHGADARGGAGGNLETALVQQLHARQSDLKQEEAQLTIEHGPNFPRLVEIRKQIQDADDQIKAADTKLTERFRGAWKTSLDRERLLRRSLDEATGAGLKVSEAGLQYAAMWQETNANREVYLRMMQQAEEAGLAAGSMGSTMSVIDYARPAVKPVLPNLPVDMAIALFVGFWAALSVVLGREAIQRRHIHPVALAVCLSACLGLCRAQAPTPSTSGLPTGVARLPQSGETKSEPNAKDAPTVWNAGSSKWAGAPPGSLASARAMEAPIGAGDMLEVTEAHGPELHAMVRVSEAGTVTLTLAGEVKIDGLDERGAAHAIEAALKDRGMLLRPQVTVLVTTYAGQDVSVLGEVARPGVYSYTVHHRLLDLISAASGLSQNAGRLVTITHRSDSEKQETVVLDPAAVDANGKHNPELLPGDTVQVNRAGLVYVVGDVIRPGGFLVEPAQTTSVVQALSLAWGPAQNAALKKAVLIRKQAGGRTVTTLNLKRMLRGLDPDTPVQDGDILFVPDSMAKNLWNRSLESVIQSAAGVSIYSGLVYSQRF